MTAPSTQPWAKAHVIPSGTHLAEAIRLLAAECLPGVPVHVKVGASARTSASWHFDPEMFAAPSRPWDDMAEFAHDHGLVLGYDAERHEITLRHKV